MRIATIFVFLFFWIAQSSWAGPSIPVSWEVSPTEKGTGKVDLAMVPLNDFLILGLEFDFPLTGATELAEINGDGETVPLDFVKEGEKPRIRLTRQSTKLLFKKSDGTKAEMNIRFLEAKSELIVASSCKKIKMKAITLSNPKLPFPGVISCRYLNNEIDKVVFSTLGDAEWLGSEAFETEGKGERWKSFAYKEIVTLKGWQLNWGNPEEPVTAKIILPRPTLQISEAYPFWFSAGISSIQGTIEKNSLQQKVSGTLIPFNGRYQKTEKTPWFLGAQTSFYLSSFSNEKKPNTINSASGWAGVEMKVNAFSAKGMVGYSMRILTIPGLSVNSSLEAPGIGADFSYGFGNSLLGLQAFVYSTENRGKLSDQTLSLYYHNKGLLPKDLRIIFSQNNIKASNPTLTLKGSLNSLSLALFF